MRQYNLPLLQKVRTVGRYDMPMLAKQDVTPPDTLMGFNYATGKKTVKHCGIHFFIDDYQFQRVWNQPDRYIAPLKRFQCVLTPDFSTYMDMPEAMKIYNVFRSRLIGAYWQACGLKVIPTLQWAGPESFPYCFSGIPNNSTVAVSTVGTNDNPTAELYWRLGMRYAIDRLAPEKILLYGDAIPFFDFSGIEVVTYKNSNAERMKKMGGRGSSSGTGRGGHGGGGGGSSSDLSSVSDTDLTKMMRDAGNRMDTASEIMQRTAHGATQYNQRMPESVFPEATKANYDKYRAASKAFRTARAQRDRISDEQIRRQPKSSGTSHAFVNSFGEATTREITNQNYQRSQKSLSKSVLRNMGY